MQLIPFLYHPTTVAIVDDDYELVNNLQLLLAHAFRCVSFTSAREANKTIIDNYKKNQANVGGLLGVSYEDSPNLSVNLNFDNIHQQILNPDRFKKIMVAIIDYDMAEMNGLALARALKNEMPIKIIMLTGEADEKTAVKAFNNKEIDRFVLKSSENYDETLIDYINQLQLDSFTEMSKSFVESLNNLTLPLQEKDFIDLFNKIVNENKIVEYYCLDESGSYLMCDALAKNIVWFIVKTDEDMKMFCDLLKYEDDVPQDMIDALKNRKNILFSKEINKKIVPLQDWEIKAVTKLNGKEIYYCTLQGNDGYDFDTSSILSYNKFLKADNFEL